MIRLIRDDSRFVDDNGKLSYNKIVEASDYNVLQLLSYIVSKADHVDNYKVSTGITDSRDEYNAFRGVNLAEDVGQNLRSHIRGVIQDSIFGSSNFWESLRDDFPGEIGYVIRRECRNRFNVDDQIDFSLKYKGADITIAIWVPGRFNNSPSSNYEDTYLTPERLRGNITIKINNREAFASSLDYEEDTWYGGDSLGIEDIERVSIRETDYLGYNACSTLRRFIRYTLLCKILSLIQDKKPDLKCVIPGTNHIEKVVLKDSFIKNIMDEIDIEHDIIIENQSLKNTLPEIIKESIDWLVEEIKAGEFDVQD